MSRLTEALQLNSLGLHVMPLHPGGKSPKREWGRLQQRSQSSGEVHQMFGQGADDNIGIICGKASDNLVVLDFDVMNVFQDLCQKTPAFKQIVDSTITVVTSRGIHVYIRVAAAVAKQKYSELGIDVLAQGSYAVAPPSAVNGHVYSYSSSSRQIQEVPSLSVLDIGLSDNKGCSVIPSVYTRFDPNLAPLVKKSHIPIFGGDKGSFASRSEAEQSVIVELLKNGYTEVEVQNYFEANATEGSKYREKERHRSKWLKSSINNARTYLSKNRREIDITLDDIEGRIDTYVFPGAAGASDLAVSKAVLRIARSTGRTDGIDLSVRRVSEESGVSQGTAAKVLNRLPFLRKQQKHTGFKAATYSIDMDWIHAHMPTPNPTTKMVDTRCPFNVFIPRALSRSTYKVYLSLATSTGEWITRQDIATKAGVCDSTLRKALRRLSQHLTIQEKTQGRHILVRLPRTAQPQEWAVAARKLGTSDTFTRAKEVHQRERDQYRRVTAWKSSTKRQAGVCRSEPVLGNQTPYPTRQSAAHNAGTVHLDAQPVLLMRVHISRPQLNSAAS